ncbi:MAG: RNA ligase family protein [Nitrososphaerales archaeon]
MSEIMERKLATVQMIKYIKYVDADNIECAEILGWSCVVKKGDFKTGDLCVYCEYDSVLPVREEFEFLRKSCFDPKVNGFRIRTVIMRGQVSQGIAFPISILKRNNVSIGDDVTQELGIKLYEPEIPDCEKNQIAGKFNNIVPNTKEVRIQSIPNVLDNYYDEFFVITEKVDGFSSTFYSDDEGKVHVGKRNWEFKDGINNVYTHMVKKYGLEEILGKTHYNIAIQGEIIGPGIRKNKYKLNDFQLWIFNIFDIEEWKYWSFKKIWSFCDYFNLLSVPIIGVFNHLDYDSIIGITEGNSFINRSVKREGIVVRSINEINDNIYGRLSFKSISSKFLIDNKE